jgi:hypothetical protein
LYRKFLNREHSRERGVFELIARQFDSTLRLVSVTFIVLSYFAIPGCGGPKVAPGAIKKAPISGTVTFKGQPLEDAEVYFHTEKFTGFAKTDEEGKYILAQGAAIGPNKVFFSKLEGGSAAIAAKDPVLELNDPGQVDAANMGMSGTGKKGPKQLIPPEFNTEKATKLTFDVPEGGAKDADFNL